MVPPDLLAGTDPRALRWSDPILRMRDAAPGIPITVWCNEDAPLIWPQILRSMAGFDQDDPVEGGLDGLDEIMTGEGLERLQAYIDTLEAPSAAKVRRLSLAFLERFTDEDATVEEIDMPGWTEADIERLGAIYDEDIEALQEADGVTVIFP